MLAGWFVESECFWFASSLSMTACLFVLSAYIRWKDGPVQTFLSPHNVGCSGLYSLFGTNRHAAGRQMPIDRLVQTATSPADTWVARVARASGFGPVYSSCWAKPTLGADWAHTPNSCLTSVDLTRSNAAACLIHCSHDSFAAVHIDFLCGNLAWQRASARVQIPSRKPGQTLEGTAPFLLSTVLAAIE